MQPGPWYLGLDIGTTAIAATLVSLASERLFPLYWSARSPGQSEPPRDRLPAIAYFARDPKGGPLTVRRLAVGAPALQLARQAPGLWLDGLKPYLNTALPFYSRKRRQWEPQLRGYGEPPVPLFWLQRGLQAMLATLTPAGSKQRYVLAAKGLTGGELRAALLDLQGIVASCPAGWGEAYRFNVREAALGAGLVSHPAQVFFLPEVTAALLESRQQGGAATAGPLLAIHGGASHVELAIARPPAAPTAWTPELLSTQSLAYGSNALSLDIFSHLLYPQWRSQQSFLHDLEFIAPPPGQPAEAPREQALAALHDFPAGRSLLATAWRAALILQQQPELQANLGAQTWSVRRADLEATIFAPLAEPFNQAVNALLSQQGLAAGEIAQIVWSGGFAPMLAPALQPWLARKFPQAQWAAASNQEPGCLVARGLARLPLHPHLLDRPQHQYSDYFLLSELLAVLAEGAVLTWPEIRQRLEQRGLNTRPCQTRLLALLAGELPAGLLPLPVLAPRLAADSRRCVEYRALAAAAFCQVDAEQRYQLNPRQSRRLQQFLMLALTGAKQSLDEPLSADLGGQGYPLG